MPHRRRGGGHLCRNFARCMLLYSEPSRLCSSLRLMPRRRKKPRPAAATSQEKFQGIELAIAEAGFSIRWSSDSSWCAPMTRTTQTFGLTEARRLVKNENVIAILGNLFKRHVDFQSIHTSRDARYRL